MRISKKDLKFLLRFQRFAAFTLAEVLITLAIIGVVAAVTIPSLLNETNDKETVVKLKKIYSDLNAATNYMVAENGPIKSWDWDSGDSTMESIMDGYKKYLKIDKACPFISPFSCYIETNWKALNGNSYFTYFHGGDGYYNILQDGSYIKFYKILDPASYGAQLNNQTPRIEIVVNLNGNKPPNQVGRDVFFFFLTQERGVMPPYYSYVGLTHCDSSSTGTACTGKVLKEDAINY